jgi:hypothetical protein
MISRNIHVTLDYGMSFGQSYGTATTNATVMPQGVKAEMEERLSLYPLDPEKALAALLQVDPNSEPVDETDES